MLSVEEVNTSFSDYSDLGITLPDSELDTLVSLVINSYTQSTKSLWDCAKYTWVLFENHGMYERDFTNRLCANLSINRDTIYHWRKAWDIRLKTSETLPNPDNLSISHYYHSADYEEKLGTEFIASVLEVANEECWSTRKLSAELETASGDAGTIEWLMKKIANVRKKFHVIYDSSEMSGLSNEKREKLKEILSLIDELLY